MSFRRFALLILALWLGQVDAQISTEVNGEKRLEQIMAGASGENARKALEEIRAYIEEIRATPLDSEHPAVAYARACAGVIAANAGEYEVSIAFLREALPILREKVRPDILLYDEFGFTLSLSASLLELEDSEGALVVLEDLRERVKTQLDWVGTGILSGRKGFQDDGRESSISPLYASEEWLFGVLDQIGELRLKREEWPEAEQALKEASEILERLHPEKKSELADLREKWERAAREQGKAIRPRYVGRFSSPRSIVFEGVDSIPVEEIRSALLRSSSFVLASHPAGDFEGYLEVLKRCLELGYRASGFPDVSATVEWDEEVATVVARIEEGTGYRAGSVHIDGVDAEMRRRLLDRIVIREDSDAIPSRSRGDFIFQEIQKQKKIPAERVEKVLMETFPELAAAEKSRKEKRGGTVGSSFQELFQSWNPLMEDEDDEKLPPIWETGERVDYRSATLGSVRRRLREVYVEEGKPFVKFEVDWDPDARTGIADLQIRILSEGPVSEFGEIHVVGNRINSREELLAFLDIDTGKEARGNLKARIGRKLYESGRFLGWQVESFRKDPRANRIDLLIIVEEQWEAPPLSAPLSRVQEAMLRFGRWLNEEAGMNEGICIDAYGMSEDFGDFEIQMIFRDAASLFALEHSEIEHGIVGMSAKGEASELLVTKEGKTASFRASFPSLQNPGAAFFWITEQIPRVPDGPSGNVSFGVGTRSSTENGRSVAKTDFNAFGIDPASLLKQCGAWTGYAFYLEDGFLVHKGGGLELKVEEETGRLESLKSWSESHYLEIALEEDLLEEGLAEIGKLAKTAPDWGEGKDPYSLGFLAFAFMAEAAKDLSSEESEETPDEFVSRIGSRTLEKWSRLAALSGEALGSFLEPDTSDKEDPFDIPFDSREFEGRYQSGGNLMLVLGLGFYDYLAAHTEPGTWPDLVLRESLFLIDGKPLYLNQTIDALLEDENMGPLGCLICSGLLQKIGHDSALRFVQKAREQLTEEGFAADWNLLLTGKAEEEGVGGMIIEILKALDDAQVEEFLTSSSEEARAAVKDLLSKARAIEGEPDADSLAPVMDSLWANLLREPITELVDKVENSLTPKIDPAVFAAVVDGAPVPRGAVRLYEKVRTNPFGYTPTEEGIVTLLMAKEVWSRGHSATPEAIERKAAEMISSHAGGWEGFEAMGFSRKLFDWWVGVQLASEAQAGLWARSKEASEEEARSFYDRHADQFGATLERNVRLIAVKKVGDGKRQKEMLNRILGEIRGEEDMEERKRLFGEAVVATSSRMKPGEKGDFGWIKPGEEFFPALAKAIGAVPDGEISEVFEANGHLFLILIPEESRPGKPKPFEEVAQFARLLAILEREQQILRKRASVIVYEEPEEEASVIAEAGESEPAPEPEPSATEKLASIGERLLSSAMGESRGDPSEEGEEEEDTRSLLEIAIEDAPKGDPNALYLLGTFSERDLGPEPGLEAAVASYRKAAEAGERRAMLRLSELYRIGRGVPEDEKKSEEWRRKADSEVLQEEEPEPRDVPEAAGDDAE